MFVKFLLVSALVGIIALLSRRNISLRHSRLAAHHEEFRKEFQTNYDEVNSLFNHREIFVDDLKWHFVDQGPEDGKVILFLHGFPESWYSWRYVLPLIDPRYRLIALDMKGYGRSDKPLDGNYEWHNVAREINDFMTQGLGVDKYYVVGHDWGTLIGSVLVDDHQSHILGFVRMQVDLILIDFSESFASFWKAFKNRIQFLYFQTAFTAEYIVDNADWLVKFIYKTRLLSQFSEIDRKYITYELSLPNAFIVYKYFQFFHWDFHTAMTNICKNSYSFPVMQLQADSDPTQPVELFDSVATECPNVEMYWVYNASHFSNFDQPEAVANAINYFLNKHDRD